MVCFIRSIRWRSLRTIKQEEIHRSQIKFLLSLNPKFNTPKNKELTDLQKFSDLKDHPAFVYIEHRKIPEKHLDKLYLAENFYKWSRTMFPEKFQSINIDYPFSVIPFFDKSGKCLLTKDDPR